MPLSASQRDGVRLLLSQTGWSTVWQSLEKIQDCVKGMNWDWQPVDDVLLNKFHEVFKMSWQAVAQYMVVGMRPRQCELRYKSIMETKEMKEME